MLSCGCRFDEDGPDEEEEDDWPEREITDVFLDANGVPCELVRVGDQEVTVHYEHLPPGDVTTVDGIPCTTPLRTVIDIAPEVGLEHLKEIVRDALGRKLFTVDEARARLAEPDMKTRRGAMLLRSILADGLYHDS
jgi:hypothetical protein